MKNSSERRRAYLAAIASAHEEWEAKHLHTAKPKPRPHGIVYNMHYLDVDGATPAQESDLHERIQKKLAALPRKPAKVEKAAPRWLAWEEDKELAAHYAGKVVQAFQDAIAAIRAFLSRLFSGEVRMTPTQAAQEVQAMISVALRAELLPLWRDGWNLGQDSAHHMLDRPRGEGAGEPQLQAYIGSRAPNIIARVAETRLDDLPALIAGAQSDDLTPAEAALAIAKQLDGESRSELIAQTELAAVINAGAMAAYHDAGVDKKDWLVAPEDNVCFPAGTQILTVNGSVSIENLQVGDRVITPQGSQVITAVSKRAYTGGMTMIESTSGIIVATDNHPFMTIMGWRDASDVNAGDILHTAGDKCAEVTSVVHFAFAEPDNTPAEPSKVPVFSFVDTSSVGEAMPVISVCFNDNVNISERKVYDPFSNTQLRLEDDTDIFQCQPDHSFQAGFTLGSEIALKRAVPPMSGNCRCNADDFSASIAGTLSRRRSTVFGADSNVSTGIIPDSLTAPLTANVRCVSDSACPGTDSVPVSSFFTDSKISVTDRAVLSHEDTSFISSIAHLGAVFPPIRACAEKHAASDARLRQVDDSSGVITGFGAEGPLCLFRVNSPRTLVDFTTMVANIREYCHDTPRECVIFTSNPLPVYNITVDVEHVYYANKFLVHNCKICRGNEADGAIPLSQAFSSGVTQGPAHPRCRCCVAPAVTGGFDLTDMHVEPLRGYNPVPLPAVTKVGPKGWVHGWHYVGGPGLPSVAEMRQHGDSTEKYAGEHDGYTAGRRDLHSKIVEESLAGHSQKKAPVAIFMGGGAGAGKSTMKSQMRGAIIDADHYKEQLPEYQALKEAGEKDAASYTYREGGRMAQDAVTEATNRGLDFTLDGAGAGGYDSMKERTDNARRGGHHVHAIYVTTDTDTAISRANARGKVTGRYVPEPIMRAAHASVSQTFRDAVQKGGLFDSAELWDNNGEAPSLIGEMKPGQPFQVHDQAAWERFLAKADEA